MKQIKRVYTFISLWMSACCAMAEPVAPLAAQSMGALEERIDRLDAELETLATFSLRSGVGAIGYRSLTHEQQSEEWIEIDLGAVLPIDQIVLVPSIWRDSKFGFRADGFPVEFRILVGDESNSEGDEVASFSEADCCLPRIAPLIVDCSVTGSWVRVEATQLSPRAWDGMFDLQLAEILVFNGAENVALLEGIKTSSNGQREGKSRKERFLVDGFVPYLMDSYDGKQSIAYVSEIASGVDLALTLDLGAEYSLDRIHLHSVDLSDTVPQSTPADFGIPHRLVVEGARSSDFSDAVVLCEYQKESVFDVGPIMMRRFAAQRCRYVRITAIEPYLSVELTQRGFQIGFAEIELFSQGMNVALEKPWNAVFQSQISFRNLEALTDGCNLYGRILPVREWMNQLERRHDLETERPQILEELSRRYAKQKKNVHRLMWIAALLAAGIGFTFLIDRLVHQRTLHRTRERIAADLHDELGANLHAIGLLGGVAEESVDDREYLIEVVRRIRALTKRTGAATRLCTNMLEADELCADLVVEIRRASDRLLADLEHKIEIDGEEMLRCLKPRTRVDLFLFYKECLTNIIRHSGASRASTLLAAGAKEIVLTICDDGQGMEQAPPSLTRRARLLGARLAVESLPSGGTRIQLKLRKGRRPFSIHSLPHTSKGTL